MLDLLIRNARIVDGTGAPSFMGDLGVLAEGKVADLVLFDPDTVTAKTPRYAYDLPGNGPRLVAESEGIKATFVGAMPGRILRSTR